MNLRKALLHFLFPDIVARIGFLEKENYILNRLIVKKNEDINQLTNELTNMQTRLQELTNENSMLNDENKQLHETIDDLIREVEEKKSFFYKRPPKTLKVVKSWNPYASNKPFMIYRKNDKLLARHRKGYDPMVLGTYLDPLVDKIDKHEPKHVFDTILMRVQQGWNYIFDSMQWGYVENWTPTNIVYHTKEDDCESLAQLVVAGFYWYEMKNKPFDGVMACMAYGDWFGTRHGWPMLFTDDKAYLGEATLYKPMPSQEFGTVKGYNLDSLTSIPIKANPYGGWKLARGINKKTGQNGRKN